MRVGDYVRTKHYGITKVLKIYNNTTTNYLSAELDKIDSFGRLGVSVSNDEIIKTSPNIIDLIEVGDYVNGSYIYSIVEENKNTGQPRVLFTEEDGVLGSGEIKSIVTKEQFESMEYKVESEVK